MINPNFSSTSSLCSTSDENEDFNPKFKDLVEETFTNAGNQRVVILAHSLGALYGLNFLNKQSVSWKKKYVKALVVVSGPLGGSMKALKIEASGKPWLITFSIFSPLGDNFGIYFQNSLWYREVQRSMPSLAFLLPDPRLWGPNEPVIFTPKKNYTIHDYKEFFLDVGYPEGMSLNHNYCILGYQMYLDTKSIVDGFVGPTGIDEVYCFYGTGIHTTAGMVYTPATRFNSAFPDQNPSILVGDGDGTVNLRSLEQCTKWDGVQYETLPNADHLGILRDERLISKLKKITNADKVARPRHRSLFELLVWFRTRSWG